jgi:WD40 repeat protein/mono/diheme cytochrome c family protein
LVAGALRAQENRAPTTEDVLSIFSRRCVECHGIAKQSGKLRLDGLEAIFRGGKSGPAIVAGKSAESLLYRKVSPDAEKRMPPKGDPLSDGEIGTIRSWIDAGARAAAAAGPPAGAATFELKPLPRGFAPLAALAGDPTGPRVAIGRGNAIEILQEPVAGGGKEGVKDEGKEAAGKALQPVTLLRGPLDVVQSLTWSPDGNALAAGEFRTVRVWDTRGWKLLHALEGHADRVLCLAFSPDSKRLAAGGGQPTESGEVKVWDLETGKLLWSATPHTDTVLGLDFSSDGQSLITGAADRVTYLLDARTGKISKRLEGHTNHVLAVALAPDGKRAATAGGDRVVRLWDLEGGEPRTLRGHEGAVTSIGFTKDGKRLVSASGDGTARLWNPGNGNAEATLGGDGGYLQAAAVFAGGTRFATGAEDGTVRIYDLEKRKLLRKVDRPDLTTKSF